MFECPSIGQKEASLFAQWTSRASFGFKVSPFFSLLSEGQSPMTKGWKCNLKKQ
jgi:hypothetical protein